MLERAGHVLELLKKMDIEQLKSFSAIVIVSGDGLVYEVCFLCGVDGLSGMLINVLLM